MQSRKQLSRKQVHGKKRLNGRKQMKPMNHKGGAIYTFDLDDKIGGLPARVSLNGTQDGDCPSTDTADLGFVNYGMKRGGGRRHKTTRRTNSSRKHKKSKKSKKNRKTQRR
jgi:hypothetical protein